MPALQCNSRLTYLLAPACPLGISCHTPVPAMEDRVHLGMTVLLLPALPLTRAPGSPRAEASRQRAWANGLAAWRRRSGLAPAARVFVLTGPFPDARAALAARGFAENPDPASACFDLKWSLRGREARVSARNKQPTHKRAVNKRYQNSSQHNLPHVA